MNMMTKASASALAMAGAAPLDLETKDAPAPSDVQEPAPTAEIKKLLVDLQKENKEFQDSVSDEIKQLKKGGTDPLTEEKTAKINEQLDKLQDQVKKLRLEDARPEITGADGTKRRLSDGEVKHRAATMSYLRKGLVDGFEDDEVKALSVGSDPDGGYLVDSVMDAEIARVVSEISPMRQLASVTGLGTATTYKKLVNIGGASSGWVGESGSRTETATPKLQERKFSPDEIYAMPYITQNMLDDGAIDLEAWLSEEVRVEFAEQESDAFINGDGVDKPRGIIGGYDPIDNANFTEAGKRPGFIGTGAAGDFAAGDGAGEDNLLDVVYGIKRAYRSNARWLMARPTIGKVRKMRDADGRALWQPMTTAGEPAQLVGFPVEEDDEMPLVANGSYSVAFGDFRASYRIVDKGGTRVLRDPYSVKGFVQLYTTRRVGGGVQMFESFKLLKFSA